MKYIITLLFGFALFSQACQSNKETNTNASTSSSDDQTELEHPAQRFESQILAFEKEDKNQMPESGGIIFTGSSSIRMWKTANEDMGELAVINRGFGGSTLPDLLYYLDRIVLPYKPRCIVLYEGDNDITNEEITPEVVLNNLKTYQKRIQDAIPGTKTFFLSIKPSISRKHLLEKAITTNALIKAHCETDSLMEFVDIASVMMESEHKIRSDIFIEDSLHMNSLGYELWTPIVKNALLTHCK